ncbi:MAG TPA: CHASE2 domain-containing protein [Nostocaceae cyanobacterium]|nr:CHASE2 domain-containing protein [Nostocaceae cyanobacterium]
MGKLVVLKFGEGSFDQGFSVTLQISEERQLPSIEITGKLPPAPELLQAYNHWQSSYRSLGSLYRLYAKSTQRTNVSKTADCNDAADLLKKSINSWLQAEEFRRVREKWLEGLLPTEEIRVIVQTENGHLQRLPWHLWDLLERFPKAEIALSPINYEINHKQRTPNLLVNVLAIVGNSQGIDTQADQVLLKQYSDADVQMVLEPQRQELTDHLWGKNWDILFFAGHSCTHDNETGRIYLNSTDSLTIKELKYALRKAVDSGLQLAIFNSCDGLGLARELADLQIPQIIVMREPVPDEVAQEFLKYFLQFFASGESLYQSVRQARQRLQGLEHKFPCATWLPVICQNPVQIPLTWQELKSPAPKSEVPLASPVSYLKVAMWSSLAITILVCCVRLLGLLQGGELRAFDQMMRSRPDEGTDRRLLVVTVDEADLVHQRNKGEILKGTSISDKSLNLLLAKLEQYKPIAIGLDIYRDFPTESPELKTRFQNTSNLFGVCKGSYSAKNIKGIEPSKDIPANNLGFSDFVSDADGVVRRHLLFMTQEAGSPCSAVYGLSTQLAFRYLYATKGIKPNYTSQEYLQLGEKIFPRLSSRMGGYQVDDKGQIMLNYRATEQIAEQVSLTQFLSTPVNPSYNLENRIVLIGVISKGDLADYWATPYGNIPSEEMPGVLVHAHKVSQILSAVIDGRPLLRVWNPWIEVLWIWGWSVVGGVIVWRSRSLPQAALAVGVSSFSLYIICLGLLVGGIWAPFVPSALSLVATVGLGTMQKEKHQSLTTKL